MKQLLLQHSINPDDSSLFVLMINLSRKAVEKVIDGKTISIHKYQSVGMIAYPPGSNIISTSQPGEDHELLVVRFSKSLLIQYFGENNPILKRLHSIAYEDLDYQSEQLILEVIDKQTSKIKAHGLILEFIGKFIDKLLSRDSVEAGEQLHPDDLKGLFITAGILRDPLIKTIPSVPELSKMANMGTTKFKSLFKQVFGSPVKQYHAKIKMDYAQKQIVFNRRTISE